MKTILGVTAIKFNQDNGAIIELTFGQIYAEGAVFSTKHNAWFPEDLASDAQ